MHDKRYVTNGLCYENIKVDPQPTRLASCSCRGAALCLFSKVDAHCPFPQSPLPSPHPTPTGIPRLRRLLASQEPERHQTWTQRSRGTRGRVDVFCKITKTPCQPYDPQRQEEVGQQEKKKRMPLALPGRGQAAGECLRSRPARQHGIAGTPPAAHGRLYSVATAAATTEQLLGVGDVRPVHRVRPRRNQISVWYC